MKETFKTVDGITKEGYIVRQYNAFEGGMRYIFKTDNGEYRCIKNKNNEYVEYRP